MITQTCMITQACSHHPITTSCRFIMRFDDSALASLRIERCSIHFRNCDFACHAANPVIGGVIPSPHRRYAAAFTNVRAPRATGLMRRRPTGMTWGDDKSRQDCSVEAESYNLASDAELAADRASGCGGADEGLWSSSLQMMWFPVDMSMQNSSRVPASKTGPSSAKGDPATIQTMQGCPVHHLRSRLREAGLRPTRQRVALGWLLFAKGDRHVTAEKLYEEATGARVPISLATVYNTLHQFTEAGLLREIAVDGSKTYFDTNVANHHHFLFEDTNLLVDIPHSHIAVGALPEAPEGMEVSRVDVIVRLAKKPAGPSL